PEGALNQILESYALFVRWSQGEDVPFDSSLLASFVERAPLSNERTEVLRNELMDNPDGNLLDLWDAICWARGLAIEAASHKIVIQPGDVVRRCFHRGVLLTYQDQG